MHDNDKRLNANTVSQMVIYLCLQTGITEHEAEVLIARLGIDKNSLLREAREIRQMRSRRQAVASTQDGSCTLPEPPRSVINPNGARAAVVAWARPRPSRTRSRL